MSGDPEAAARMALEELNLSIADWEQERTPATIKRLDAVLSADLIFRRADRSVVGKPAFMEALAKPSPFAERRSDGVSIDIVGDRAVATLTVTTTNAAGEVGRFRNVRVFFRHGQDWQLEVWFNDNVSDLKAL